MMLFCFARLGYEGAMPGNVNVYDQYGQLVGHGWHVGDSTYRIDTKPGHFQYVPNYHRLVLQPEVKQLALWSAQQLARRKRAA